MQTVNFQASPDFSAEAEDIARRRKYAELLQEQSMQPLQGQMAGRYYVAPSWTQGLNKAAQGLIGGYGERDAGERQKALAEKLRTQGVADVEGFMGALNGKAAQAPMTPNDDDGNPNPMIPAMPGDKRQALAVALGSQNPMVKQAGSALLAQMLKAEEPYNLRKDEKRYGPDGRVIASNEAPRTHVINGQVVRETENGIVPLGGPVAPQVNPANDLLVPDGKGGYKVNDQLVGVKTQLAQAGKPSITSTVINAGPKAFETELGKLDAEKLGELRKGAEAANNSLAVVQNLRAAVNQGVYSGGGALAKTAASNMINGLTGATPKNLPGSQLFNAEASKLVLEHVKSLGANPSNADREFIEKTVPMLNTSPQARDAMINFIEQKSIKTLNTYKQADAYARKNHGLGGFDIVGGAPAAATAPAGGVVDFNSLPKGP